MKFLIVLAALGVAAQAAARPEESTYDERYDNFNVAEVVDNDRLLKSFALCFLGEGRCTPDGNNFKKWIPDAVQTECSKCTDKQKVLVAKVIKAMQAKLPTEWGKLLVVHDPDKKYRDILEAFLAVHAA